MAPTLGKLSYQQVRRNWFFPRHLLHEEGDARCSTLIANGARPIRVHVTAKLVRPLLTSHDDPTPVPERQEVGRQLHRPNHRRDGNKDEPPGIGEYAHVLPTLVELALPFGAEAEPKFGLPTVHSAR